jgi:hypothetical protein
MKAKPFVPLFAAALALAAVQQLSAQTGTYVVGSPRAVIRGGANASTDQVEGTGASIKFNASPFDTARKYYVKFDLTGQNPNTNGPLYIRYDTILNSQRQDVQVWSLDQAFAGFTSAVLTWNTAQANDTASGSGLLTNGVNTGTYYNHFLSASTGNVIDSTHQLHGPWGHMIRSGNIIYMAMTSINNIGDNGLRLADGSVEIAFDTLTTGNPPSLGALTNQLAVEGLLTAVQGFNSTATNFFTVADVETAIGSLTITNATSSEANLGTTNIIVLGSGASRSLYVTAPAAATPGTYTIVLYLVDGDGNVATRSFSVVIQQFNLPPSIIVGTSTNSIPPTNTLVNTAVVMPFTVTDAESPKTNLAVTAEIATYSVGILASATLSGTDYNTNLAVTVTPQTGVDGVGVVRISCSDTNGNTNTLGFCVMVRSNASVIFVDHFEYNGSNTKITDDAPQLWTRRNASAQSVFLRSGTDPLSLAKVAWLRPNTGAEDLGARLVGGTYGVGSRAVLYTKFNATFADQAAGGPGINIITNDSPGEAFFRLSEAGSSTTDFMNLVVVTTNNAADPANQFRIGVGNGEGVSMTLNTTDFAKPINLTTETGPISIVTRYIVTSGKATMWINATSETDPNVSGTDNQLPSPVGYVGLFQERGFGDIYIDDLTVTLKIQPLITVVSQPSGGNLDIDFSAGAADVIGDFQLERASTVTGTYSTVSATITSLGGGNFRATVAAPGSEGYYKVKRTPVTF